ncbi:SCO family protein [Hydrogenophaga sp. RWCD_12]|uniref:SCO family protein n=1 Tax=Hydrogenophaga sp. RWCD_12 TaxID=3391190 RepID=UPI003984FDF8
MMNRRRAVAAISCGAMGGAVWPRGACAANWLPAPAVPDVSLLDQDGRALRLPELLRGRAVVVSFFFTGCTTVCPPQTALLREAARQWQTLPALRDVLVVSISVDPLGDGPPQLRDYARRFDLPLGAAAGWVLLTGSPAPVRSVLGAFGVSSGAADQHSSLLWLGDEVKGRWARTSALNPPAMTTRLFEELRT